MIDSHAHLTSEELVGEAEALAKRAREAGVEKVVNICTDRASLEAGIALRKQCPFVYNVAATTPHDVEADGEAFFPVVQEHVGELCAIGETGLDYFYEHSPKEKQREFLSRYFELAKEVELPVVFHCRDAFEDLFAMADEQFEGGRAVLHCFTGTKAEAKGCLDRGWLVSFSGIITFKKSEALREVVGYVPLDAMLVETDSPYLAPQTRRGKRNEPAWVVETAEKVAQIKGVSLAEVERATTQNATQFFALN